MSNPNNDPNKKPATGGSNNNNQNFSAFDWPTNNAPASAGNVFDWGTSTTSSHQIPQTQGQKPAAMIDPFGNLPLPPQPSHRPAVAASNPFGPGPTVQPNGKLYNNNIF